MFVTLSYVPPLSAETNIALSGIGSTSVRLVIGLVPPTDQFIVKTISSAGLTTGLSASFVRPMTASDSTVVVVVSSSQCSITSSSVKVSVLPQISPVLVMTVPSTIGVLIVTVMVTWPD